MATRTSKGLLKTLILCVSLSITRVSTKASTSVLHTVSSALSPNCDRIQQITNHLQVFEDVVSLCLLSNNVPQRKPYILFEIKIIV